MKEHVEVQVLKSGRKQPDTSFRAIMKAFLSPCPASGQRGQRRPASYTLSIKMPLGSKNGWGWARNFHRFQCALSDMAPVSEENHEKCIFTVRFYYSRGTSWLQHFVPNYARH